MNDKKFFALSIVVSVVVFGVVVILNILPKPDFTPSFIRYLPLLNATINGICSFLLLTSLYFIRRKNIRAHKKINISAFFLSSIFLVSYILYHYFSIEVRFPADNPMRPVYLIILITHILCASAILPFILMSFYRGLNMQVEKHKKIVRWSFPIWLYVTVTGVIVYLLISPYYPS
jgi:putative membrane protein